MQSYPYGALRPAAYEKLMFCTVYRGQNLRVKCSRYIIHFSLESVFQNTKIKISSIMIYFLFFTTKKLGLSTWQKSKYRGFEEQVVEENSWKRVEGSNRALQNCIVTSCTIYTFTSIIFTDNTINNLQWLQFWPSIQTIVRPCTF